MSYLASAGVAETEDGAVERMRMVLFSFTNAYYTKKLPRKLPRSVPVVPTYYYNMWARVGIDKLPR